MAELIMHIDEIARLKKRHVASIVFDLDFERNISSQLRKIKGQRKKILLFLDAHKITYEPCFEVFDGNVDPFYKGDLYIDLEIDFTNPIFCALRDMLEHSDETPRINGVRFLFLPYKLALQNHEFYRRSLDDI